MPIPISISLSKTPHLFSFFIFSMIPNKYHMKFYTKFSYIVKSDRRCEMTLGGWVSQDLRKWSQIVKSDRRSGMRHMGIT
jgi:hypothetical protein